MAICRMCHKPVPNGVDFCDDCKVKMVNKADESYLDSLLSSVSGVSAKKESPVAEAGFEIPSTESMENDISTDFVMPSAEPATDEISSDFEIPSVESVANEIGTDFEMPSEEPVADLDYEMPSEEPVADLDYEMPSVEPSAEDFGTVGEMPVQDFVSEEISSGNDLNDMFPDMAASDSEQAPESMDELSELLSGKEENPSGGDFNLDDLLASLSEDMPEDGLNENNLVPESDITENTLLPESDITENTLLPESDNIENAVLESIPDINSYEDNLIPTDENLSEENISEENMSEENLLPTDDISVDNILPEEESITDPGQTDDISDEYDFSGNVTEENTIPEFIDDTQIDNSIPELIDDTPIENIIPEFSDETQIENPIPEFSDETQIENPILEFSDETQIENPIPEFSDESQIDNTGSSIDNVAEDRGIGDFMINDNGDTDEIADALDIGLNEPTLDINDLQGMSDDIPSIEDFDSNNNPEQPDSSFSEFGDIQPIIEGIESEMNEDVQPEPADITEISEEIQPGMTDISGISDEVQPEMADITGVSDEVQPEMADITGVSDEVQPEMADITGISDDVQPEMADITGISDDVQPDMADITGISDEVQPEMADITGISDEIQPEPADITGISDEIQPETEEEGSATGVIPESEEEGNSPDYESNEDMDELLSSLLADMDESKKNEEPQEAPIEADDIESLFNTAEEMIDEKQGEASDADGSTDGDLFSGDSQPADIDAILDESGLDQNPEGSDLTGEGLELPNDGLELPNEGLELPNEGLELPTEGLEITQGDSGQDTEASGEAAVDGIDIGIGAGDISIDEPGTDSSNPDGLLVSEDIDAMFSEIGADGTNTYLSEDDLANSIEPGTDESIDNLITEIDTGEFEERIKNLDAGDGEKKAKKEKKKNWFTRLFGNIKEDLTPEQIKERQEKAKAEEEAKKKAAEDKKKRAELSKEEKEAKKAEAKAAAAEAAQKKAEEKKRKAAEAKEKAKKKKEERLAIEEFEADEGRINKAGATILFVIFAAMTIFIIVGTNIYSYNLSIKNAQEDFEVKLYNEAYYEVYGLKVKDEDIELYDKIMTVQYVNSELNSYAYYMITNNREKALDSLLKGLQRYDKYYELATRLKIEDDLVYVKSRILDKLSSEFGLTEKEAYDMLSIRDDFDYSEYLYSLLGTYDIELIP